MPDCALASVYPIPSALSLRCSAERSMPTNSAVREILPPKRLICAQQIFALEHFARLAQRQAHQVLAAVAVRHGRHHRADVLRQHRGGDHRVGIAAGQDHQPLDVVAQLAHVARPVVRLQHRHRVLADRALAAGRSPAKSAP